jgi:hypothetical protein
MSRLPQVGGDGNEWGNVLNDFLSVSLNTDGTIKASAISTKVGSTGSPTTVTNIWVGTQVAYDALTPDANTLYFIQ